MTDRILTARPVRLLTLLAMTATCCCLDVFTQSIGEEFETPVDENVIKVLPEELRKGDHFTVQDPVRNDGFVHLYTVDTPFGVFNAETTEGLGVLIHEIRAIAILSEVERSDEFGKAIAAAGKGVYKGMKGLVLSPVKSVKQAGSGIGRMFKRAHENIFRSGKSEAEDNSMKALLGVSKVKRQYAQSLGVDPYSRNHVLQQHLDEVSWASFAGGMGVSVLTAAIPGAAGAVISVSQTTAMMQSKIYTMSPSDLRIENRKTLLAMGVDEDVANLFIDDDVYSPTEQTLLVGALNDIPGAKNRGSFVAFALTATDGESARIRRRMAEMIAKESQSDSVVEFRRAGHIVVAITNSNSVIVGVPADKIYWTRELEEALESITEDVETWTEVKTRKIVVIGAASKRTHEEFSDRGWEIEEQG